MAAETYKFIDTSFKGARFEAIERVKLENSISISPFDFLRQRLKMPDGHSTSMPFETIGPCVATFAVARESVDKSGARKCQRKHTHAPTRASRAGGWSNGRVNRENSISISPFDLLRQRLNMPDPWIFTEATPVSKRQIMRRLIDRIFRRIEWLSH